MKEGSMASDKIVSSHQTKDLRIVLSQEITYPLFKNFTTLETKRIKDVHFENVHQHRAYCRKNEKKTSPKNFFVPNLKTKYPVKKQMIYQEKIVFRQDSKYLNHNKNFFGKR